MSSTWESPALSMSRGSGGWRSAGRGAGPSPGGRLRHLPDRRGVHQATLGPQGVEASLQFQSGTLAKVPLEQLAIVPDLLDDVVAPLRIDPQHGSDLPRGTEQALDVGVRIVHVLVHIGRGKS